MSHLILRGVLLATILAPAFVLTSFGWPAADEQPNPKKVVGAATRVHPRHDVWVDFDARKVILEGQVCRPDTPSIEVLACPRGTKEYEAMLAVDAAPQILEAAILLITPAEAGDESGVLFDVQLSWEEGKETKRIKAQEWALDAGNLQPAKGVWRYERAGVRNSGELLNTSNAQGVLNLHPLPRGNTLPPVAAPANGTKVKIEITLKE